MNINRVNVCEIHTVNANADTDADADVYVLMLDLRE